MFNLNNKIRFIKLYDKHHADIYRFLRLKVSTNEIAQDLTSESFTKAWDAISSQRVQYPDNERAYLYKVAKNTLIDYYRKDKREISVDNEGIIDYFDNKATLLSANIPETALDLEKDMDMVYSALGKMSVYHADLITLKYVQDLKNSEIAEILNKPEGTVRVAIHRAMQELRKQINLTS